MSQNMSLNPWLLLWKFCFLVQMNHTLHCSKLQFHSKYVLANKKDSFFEIFKQLL